MSDSSKGGEENGPDPPGTANRLSNASVAEILRSAGGNRGTASLLLGSGTASVFGRAGARSLLQDTAASSNLSLAHTSGLGPASAGFLGRGLSAAFGGAYPPLSLAELSHLSRLQQGQQMNFHPQLEVQVRAQQLLAQEQAASEARSIALFARLRQQQAQQLGSFDWLTQQQQQQQQPSLGLLLERQRILQNLQADRGNSTDHTELARTLASMSRQPVAISTSDSSSQVARAPADSSAASLDQVSARAISLARDPEKRQPVPKKARMHNFSAKKDTRVLEALVDSPDSSSSSESLKTTLLSACKGQNRGTTQGQPAKRGSSSLTSTGLPRKKRKSSTFSNSSRNATSLDKKYAIPHFTHREHAPLGIDEDNNWLSSFQCYGTFARSLTFILFKTLIHHLKLSHLGLSLVSVSLQHALK